MPNLNQIEIQNLRHLLQFGEADLEKYKSYAEGSQDQNIKQFFQQSVKSCEKNKQDLLQFLQ